ncbi:hypothetical protein [Streptomyces pacificus]|uniref:Uncharacterized protein n=1 Tax=Streptomyces pacificus TaxID=2705029 RepID=A0A6A0AU03_9ACTN|nr:hypothetical protein [Streptomyces pacificus]GFH36449.1 hypothetical protein SCWH03_26770 [Streptomyces pacificus]
MAHTAVPQRRQSSTLGMVLPAVLGVIYGLYTSFLARMSGESGAAQFAIGLVSCVVLAGLCYALGRYQHGLPRELRAAAYAVLVGSAFGYLHSLSGDSILMSVVLSAIIAAATFCVMLYTFYVHEE